MVGAAILIFLLFVAVIVGAVFAFGLLQAFVLFCSSHSSPCGYSSGMTQLAFRGIRPVRRVAQFAGTGCHLPAMGIVD
jgi:hypothetical protein